MAWWSAFLCTSCSLRQSGTKMPCGSSCSSLVQSVRGRRSMSLMGGILVDGRFVRGTSTKGSSNAHSSTHACERIGTILFHLQLLQFCHANAVFGLQKLRVSCARAIGAHALSSDNSLMTWLEKLDGESTDLQFSHQHAHRYEYSADRGALDAGIKRCSGSTSTIEGRREAAVDRNEGLVCSRPVVSRQAVQMKTTRASFPPTKQLSTSPRLREWKTEGRMMKVMEAASGHG